MRLKNVLIMVSDMDQAVDFYRQLFGLMKIQDLGETVLLTEGLVLQDKKVFTEMTGLMVQKEANGSLLYFEEYDMEGFMKKLNDLSDEVEIKIVTPYTELSYGQKLIRFYDPDGNLIEVRSPMR